MLFCTIMTAMLVVSGGTVFAADNAYLFAHFTGETSNGEQVYFATSTDGLHWTDCNNSQPVLTSNVGEKGVRDMSFCRMQNGKYILMATDLRIASGKGWDVAMHSGSKNLVIWESTDLVNWTGPRLVNVAGSIPSAGCAWAPEAIYDSTTGNYVVYWATIAPLNGVTKARVYYCTTTDFVTFSPAQLYIDRAGTQDCIDTQILQVDGTYKYVRASGDGQITFEGSNSILGSWTRIGDISGLGYTGAQVEGPILFKFANVNQWGMYVDQYASGKGYLPFVSTNLCNMGSMKVLSSSEYSMGTSKKRHGEIINITTAQLNAINAKWPSSAATYVKLRNVATGLCIDGMGRTTNGSNAGQYSSNTSTNQQWVLETVGSNYKIKNRTTGLYIDGMGRTANGSICGQYAGGSSLNQQWAKEMAGSNVKFKNIATGLYLDGKGLTANGSDLYQYTGGSSTNQQWQIVNP